MPYGPGGQIVGGGYGGGATAGLGFLGGAGALAAGPWGTAAGALLPFAANLFGGGSRRARRRAISEYRNARPQGYLTPEDYTESNRILSARGSRIGAFGGYARAGAINRAAARGVSQSPALERSLGRISQQEGGMLEDAQRQAEDFLYRTRMGREQFEQQRLTNVFNAQMGLQNQQDTRNAGFWNIYSQYLPELTDFYGTGG